jgi:DNA mismatch repair protein MutS2
MSHIIQVLREANPESLVLLDELGAGTDPQEGSALSRAILGDLADRGIPTIVTTHHGDIKAFAATRPRLMNASVEFDDRTLAPTYRLSIGLPGRSNALAIAARLGLSPELLRTAQSSLNPTDLEVDRLLRDIHEQRREAAEEWDVARRESVRLDEQRKQLENELLTLEREKQEVLERERERALHQLEDVEEQLRAAVAALETNATPEQLLSTAQDLRRLRRSLQRQRLKRPRVIRDRPIQVGQRVWVRSLGQSGELLSLPEESGEAEVQVGRVRVSVPAADLESREVTSPGFEPPYRMERTSDARRPAPDESLDLRGQRVDEVLPALESYLHDAFMSGVPRVRLVHGKGTGALRQAIRERLAEHPLVASHAPAGPREGGDGVTVVDLAARY